MIKRKQTYLEAENEADWDWDWDSMRYNKKKQ
jgi:hypothetical protein